MVPSPQGLRDTERVMEGKREAKGENPVYTGTIKDESKMPYDSRQTGQLALYASSQFS